MDPDTNQRAATLAEQMISERCKLHTGQMEQLLKEVREIRDALIGNKEFQRPGLVADVELLKVQVRKLMEERTRALGALWAFGIVGTVVGALVTILVETWHKGKGP